MGDKRKYTKSGKFTKVSKAERSLNHEVRRKIKKEPKDERLPKRSYVKSGKYKRVSPKAEEVCYSNVSNIFNSSLSDIFNITGSSSSSSSCIVDSGE